MTKKLRCARYLLLLWMKVAFMLASCRPACAYVCCFSSGVKAREEAEQRAKEQEAERKRKEQEDEENKVGRVSMIVIAVSDYTAAGPIELDVCLCLRRVRV